MKKLGVIALLILSFQALVFGQTEKEIVTQNKIKAVCQDIVDDFTTGKTNRAFDKLDENWILEQDDFDLFEDESLRQIKKFEEHYGNSIDNILVKEEYIKEFLYRLSYVVRYEKHGLVFQFTYYRGKENKWYLNGFGWDPKLTKLFDD